MNLDTRLHVPPQVISRLVGDETVLLDLASGIYFGLDNVGQSIWECVSDGKSIAEIVDEIVTEYDVDEARARKDVIDFTNTLVDRGLLVD
jgi:hypothetical protein